ncbi:MAG: universal stress protein [Dehalococcoidia bacterium]|nr:universal stress protein [Dehalococcoidia bacterium]
MYQNVLVPVDGSDVCLAAVSSALKATGPDGRLTLIAVVDTVSQLMRMGSAAANPQVTESVMAAARQTAADDIAAATAYVAEVGGTVARAEILEGRPGDVIVEYATAGGHDLVAMGTHGRSGLRRTIMGSVAEHVVRHLIGIPVLLIHPAE